MPRRRCGPMNSLDFMESLRLGIAYTNKCHHTKFIENRFYNARDMFRFDLFGHYSCVNALDVSKDHTLLASGGDCMRVLVWDLDRAFCDSQYKAVEMIARHESNIFAVAFTPDKRTLFSGGNDGMMIAHDPHTGEVIRSCELPWQVISSISVNPHQPQVCMAATCESFVNGIIGQSRGNAIYQFDLRVPWRPETVSPPEIFIDGAPHCVQYNPVRSNCIATGDSDSGLLQWDLRMLSKYEMRYQYDDPTDDGVMSLAWSSDGSRLASLPKRDSPRLYSTGLACPIASFSSSGFTNGCTLKSVTFAGPNEEYIVTGSDSFQVYMWRHDSIPRPESSPCDVVHINEASLTLTGHRSIVNQVRYCPRHYCLFSSGVEKMIKVWSIFSSPRAQGSLSGAERAPQRKRREPSQLGSLPVIGQISNDSVEEDPMMLLFFDRLLYEDETGDSSADSESGPSGDISEMFPHGLPTIRIYADSDDSSSNSGVDENSVSITDIANMDVHESSDEDSSVSSSNRSPPPNKRTRFNSDDSKEASSSKGKKSHNNSSSNHSDLSRPHVSCEGAENENATKKGQKRKHNSIKAVSSDPTSSTVVSSSSVDIEDTDSRSSLSSLSSLNSSPDTRSTCTDNKTSTPTAEKKIPKFTLKDICEPPKNMRPSFCTVDTESSDDD